MLRSISSLKLSLFSLLITCLISANVTLPQLFTDNVLLQQDTEVNVWGTASVGESVSVSGSWSTFTAQTVTGSDGKWSVKLPTPVANTNGVNYTLTVQGNNQLTLNNVAIGDVWIIAGQSNVNWTMSFNVEGAAAAVAAANYPQIRLLRLDDRPTSTPQDTYKEHGSYSGWTVCTPQTVRNISAVGYFFAHDLHENTGVPVSLIHSARAGSLARAWLPIEEIEEIDEFKGQGPWTTVGVNVAYEPTVYYNGNIAPLRQFTIRGVLWYQGESNVDIDDPEMYAQTLPKLIQGWRRVWDQGDFPFYVAHIVPWPDYVNDSYPEIIEVQNNVLALPNTGIAVTVDLASSSLHPSKKREIGERFSFLARAQIYGEVIEETGPIYKGKATVGNRLQLFFDQMGSGFSLNLEIAAFEVAGVDRQFYPAAVEIDASDSIFLSHPQVPEPKHVRYAWNTYPQAGFWNEAGLPTPPFRSDIPDYITSVLGHVPQLWAGYDVVDDAYIYLPLLNGWTSVDRDPWLFSYALQSWVYLDEVSAEGGSSWVYIAR